MGDLAAVVFDFDGLMVDTETPIFEMAQRSLAEMGHDIDVEMWSKVVGLGDAASFAAMCAAIGAQIDRERYEAIYRGQDRAWYDAVPASPGVVGLLDALADAGIPVGIASSSPAHWIERHLGRLGLRNRFSTIASEDRVGGRAKPAPDTYLLACADLGVDPSRAVALEDSAHGIAAALAAGLTVVAVPSPITAFTDLSAAHQQVSSLADLTVDDLQSMVASRHTA